MLKFATIQMDAPVYKRVVRRKALKFIFCNGVMFFKKGKVANHHLESLFAISYRSVYKDQKWPTLLLVIWEFKKVNVSELFQI